MKSVLRQLLNSGVAMIAPALWHLRRRSLLVIMYHRVLPAGHPDRLTEQPGMYVSPQTLAMHLDILSQRFTLMHLDEWLQASVRGETVPERACAITFDDGWRDNYEFAFPELKRAAAPATIFLVSDLVGSQYGFWPNALARHLQGSAMVGTAAMPTWLNNLVTDVAGSPHAGRLDAGRIDRIIVACKEGHSDEEMLDIVRGLGEAGAESSAVEARDLMDWRELRELADSGLVRFGSHTRRHTRLSRVASAEVLRDEVIGSREEIARQLGRSPALFCYPNGDYSGAALEMVRSGYIGAVTTERGWHTRGADPFLIPRIGVHEDISNSPAAFRARLSGWI